VKLLGIETSGRIGSVALSLDGRIETREIANAREQTERLLAVVDELLAGARLELTALDGIAFGRGPGSFTGLRVAAAVAQGLSTTARVPLLPVSSLLCLAQRALRTEQVEHVVACVDAHMGEIYWGEFELRNGRLRAASPERLGAPADLTPPSGSAWAAVGSGFAAQREALGAVLAKAQRALPELEPAAQDLFPAAAEALAAGLAASPREALPVYLREHTAWRRAD
jgi:tRNA threonylcarbamoyladenosine biosynthesis protein TsaB